MGDFYQNGVITTLHNLNRRPVEELEAELKQFSQVRPLALILPSLFSELEGPALKNIIEELKKVDYLDEIIIGLDAADEAQYRYALKFFSVLPQRKKILWNDGPRLKAIDAKLKSEGISPVEKGKGRNVWFCMGYALASGRSESVAMHDCDILTYKRDLLARLIYPVANPNFNYMFCKGYYARLADGKMNGRVNRLLVTPLIRALKKTCAPSEVLDYLDSFRYSLAGEFSFRTDVISDIRIPTDWGLEIGVLSELKRNYATSRICQVDIADTYDHKHQELSPEDASKGLSKMSTDISKALFRKLATNGEIFSTESFRTIKATYYRIALDLIVTYQNDAMINGLSFDRHKEEQAVETFAQCIMAAGSSFLENPMDTPFIPSWNRVISALPDLQEEFLAAVDADMEQYT
ncbi:MAG TPA: glycosyl transferase [Methylophilaceae bacterium]|nr:glycosyl transferase [Methylophilaceae bacterium]